MSSHRINIAWIAAIVLLSTNLFSQNGYKNFKWNESLDKIKNKVPDLESFPPETKFLLVAFSYQNSQLYETFIPDPVDKLNGEISAYASENEDLAFYFLDSKLFAIEMTVSREKISKDLEAKYGRVPSKFVDIGYGDSREIKAWFNSKGRVITYCKILISPLGEETVGYINSTIYNKAAEQLKKERSLQIKANRKKID
jgi:hypothetical protein